MQEKTAQLESSMAAICHLCSPYSSMTGICGQEDHPRPAHLSTSETEGKALSQSLPFTQPSPQNP